MERTRDLTPHDCRRVAVEAHVDPRTVKKYINGGYVLPCGRARIEEALRRLGYATAPAAGIPSSQG